MKSIQPVHFLQFALAALICPESTLWGQETVGGEWQQTHRYAGENKGDHFGYAISPMGDIDGDGWRDWAIGAPGAENTAGAKDAGFARVYSGRNGRAIYEFEGGNAYDHMGAAIASPRDVDGDGFHDILVAADWMDANGLHNSGSVFLFSGATGDLIHRWDGTEADANLGTTISGVGDFDGDGTKDILAGAPFADNPATGDQDTGAVFVFSGSPPFGVIKRFNGLKPQDQHGRVVTGVGDLDGDGIYDLVAGSPYAENQGKPYAGAIFMYSGDSGNVIYRLGGLNAYDYFGTSVERIYDIDDDGSQDFLVGAPGARGGGDERVGGAFLFSGATGTLIRTHFGVGGGDQFGARVAGITDIDRDGVKDYAIGADHADPNGIKDAGSVFLYSGLTGSLLARWDGEHEYAYYGRAICGTGGFVANNQLGILIGTEWADPNNEEDAGIVDLKCYDPFLYAEGDRLDSGLLAARISASEGGMIEFRIDFPDKYAGCEYRVLMSKNGPSVTHFRGLNIPMAMDYWARNSWAGQYASLGFYQNFQGVLDAEGKGYPVFAIGPNRLENWRTYRVIALALAPGTSTPIVSSGPVVIEARP